MSDVPTAVAVAAGTMVGDDTPCARCGYNLRGLTTDRSCPECNTPILQSIQGNLLCFADPDWLEKLRLGMTVKLWNIVLVIIGSIVVAVLIAVGLPPVFQFLFSLAAASVGLWAAFLITTQEPRVSLAEDPVSLRRVVRGCAILGLVGEILQHTGAVSAHGSALIVVGVTLGGLTIIVSYFGEFIYLRRFARRIPNDGLARSTTFVMWGTLAAMASAGFCLLAVAIVSGASGGGAGEALGLMGAGVFGCGGAVALLVFGVWYIRLLLQYREAFAAAARQSRYGAAQVEAPPATGPEAGRRG